MAAPLVNQTTPFPTRKLFTGALTGPAVAEFWHHAMAIYYPPVSGPAMSMLIGALAAFGVAYWVRDRANTGENT